MPWGARQTAEVAIDNEDDGHMTSANGGLVWKSTTQSRVQAKDRVQLRGLLSAANPSFGGRH